MKSKLKVSVIGCGHLGSIHSKLWKEGAAAELIGIYDIDKTRADKKAEELKCRSFASLEECIEHSDAATVAAPTSLHAEIVEKCLERGVHCFIEKPITSSYSEAEKIINMAEEKGLLIQVGHVERFNPALFSIKGMKISPLFIEAHRLSNFKPRATDVSVILDLMIHDIDIALWLVKSGVKKIEANGVAVLTETPDIANARITFENGAVANLTASRISARPMRKMRIFQKNAYLSLDFGKQEAEIYSLGEGKMAEGATPAQMIGEIESGVKNQKIYFQKPESPKINAIAEEQKAFAEAIESGSPAPVTAREAAKALKIAEMIAGQISLPGH